MNQQTSVCSNYVRPGKDPKDDCKRFLLMFGLQIVSLYDSLEFDESAELPSWNVGYASVRCWWEKTGTRL